MSSSIYLYTLRKKGRPSLDLNLQKVSLTLSFLVDIARRICDVSHLLFALAIFRFGFAVVMVLCLHLLVV